MAQEFQSVEKSLKEHLPPDVYSEVYRVMYGKQCL